MATIAEKSRTKEVIDRLQSILNNASPVPLAAGKVTVYKDEMQTLLDELAMLMDAEIKTYHEVNDRKGKIINEAKKEAEKIIYQAERSASRMRVTKRSTNVSPLDYDSLTEEDFSALSNANEIYGASLIYTDEMLTEVSKVIEDAYHNIRSDYEIVMQVLEDKMNTIISNKEELMSGLQEMDGEDRSQQILEIGQLLSDELYNERMKQRINSDEYDDGSVQLTLDLQVEQAEETARQAEEVARQTAEALEQMTAERNALMETVMEMERAQVKEPQNGAAGEAVKSQENNQQVIPQFKSKEMSQPEPETQQPEKTVTFVKPAQSEVEPVQSEVEDDEEYEIVYVTEDELEEGEEYEIEYVDEEEYEAYEAARAGKMAAKEQVETDSRERAEHIAEPTEQAKAEQPAATQKQAELNHKAEVVEPVDEKNSDMPVVPRFKNSEKITSAPSEQIAKMAKAVTTEKKYSGLISRAVANREREEAAVTVEETDDMPIKSQHSGKRGPVVNKQHKSEHSETITSKSEQAGKPETLSVKSEQPETASVKTARTEKPVTASAKSENTEQPEIASAKPDRAEKLETASAKTDKAGKPETASAQSEKSERNTSSKTNKGRKRKKAAAKSKPAENKDEDIKTDKQGNQYVQATMQYEDPYEITEF